MKIMVVTTPIRPILSPFPPIGSLSIINYLRKHGVTDVEFYNIDANRPNYEDALRHIHAAAPEVLGISSVVSTAYDYTKNLSIDVKGLLPDCLIVTGGNLAASAEVLLKRTGTDICVIGEGEKVFLNVVTRAETTKDVRAFRDIPGLMLLDGEGKPFNTGYEAPLDKTEIYDIDWRDLENTSELSLFVYSRSENEVAFEKKDRVDESFFDVRRSDKNMTIVVGSKGCVARCTFCHRWDKGIRYIPPDILMQRIRWLMDNYDVDYFIIGDENFGTDKRWLREFCEKIAPLGVLWRVGGMRVNCIDPEYIELMRDAGCTDIHYGMESGSLKMLQIMEKKTTVEDNINAMEWTLGAGLGSVVQLVIGMPGETPQTIRETIEFCKHVQTLLPNQHPNDLSINYAQALPGTPLYEFARFRGFIGDGVDGEEEYLLRISDKSAHDEFTTLNFTDQPTLVCQCWRPEITIHVNYAYVKKFGIDHYRKVLLNDVNFFQKVRPDSGYFANPKRLVERSMAVDNINEAKPDAFVIDENQDRFPSLFQLFRQKRFGLAMICYPVLIYRIRHLLILLIILKNVQRASLSYTLGLIGEYLRYKLSYNRLRERFGFDYKSLRKIMETDVGMEALSDSEMLPLRRGR